MQLYYSPPSPFVRKVHVVLVETGLIEKTELVPTVATPVETAAGPIAQNPLGKVPALAREDGPALYDSRVICRYLDHVSGTGLYPDAPALWDVLTLEATADGILDAAVLMVYEGRVRDEAHRSETWLASQWAKIERALDALESRWMSHLEGPHGIQQIVVGCALGYLDFRHKDRDWRTARPNLAAWEASYSQRPAMIATKPEG